MWRASPQAGAESHPCPAFPLDRLRKHSPRASPAERVRASGTASSWAHGRAGTRPCRHQRPEMPSCQSLATCTLSRGSPRHFLAHHQGPWAAHGGVNPGLHQQRQSETRAWTPHGPTRVCRLEKPGRGPTSLQTTPRVSCPCRPPCSRSSLHTVAPPSPPCPVHTPCFLRRPQRHVPLYSPGGSCPKLELIEATRKVVRTLRLLF